MDTFVQVTGLEKAYDGFKLSDVDLAVAPGEIVGLVGSNGAGKTTVLECMLGIVNADGGTIELFGLPVDPNRADLSRIKSRIGVVLDTCAFPRYCRVKDVSTLGKAAYSDWDAAYFDDLCKRFALSPSKKIGDLSRGMGMKLTLAFAMAHRPELLVLDEPTAGLDPLARDEVLELLRDFVSDDGHAILFSTHITTDLEKVADRVICIDGGKPVFEVYKDEIVDLAGVARCRSAEVEEILQSGAIPAEELRLIRSKYGTDILVMDRVGFAQRFPKIAVDRLSIEEYMAFMLKGDMK